MKINTKELTLAEENFVNSIFDEFKKYSNNVEIEDKGEILGIREPNRHFFCYFVIYNDMLCYKFKEQYMHKYKEGLDLSKEVKETIDLFGEDKYFYEDTPVSKSKTVKNKKSKSKKLNNLVDLTLTNKSVFDELKTSKASVTKEEIDNLDKNYKVLKDSIIDTQNRIPNPEVKEFTTGIDKDDKKNIVLQKGENDYYWNEIKELKEYYNNNQLYVGHLSRGGEDCYIMDSPWLKTRRLDDGTILINADDKQYSNIAKSWKFPKKDALVDYSRNIDVVNRQVKNVDIVYDSMNAVYSTIQDQYLLNALVKNKYTPGIKSIIKTIQEKQDDIVTLPENETFALQGCAGSGKTMVLLHRLRYLLYNKEIDSNYLMLVPSMQFKEFIKGAAKDFRINNSNISTFKEYFAEICGKKLDDKMIAEDEINFSNMYLNRIYDKKLIQECLTSLFRNIVNVGNKLIEFCDEKLSIIYEKEKENILNKRPILQNEFISKVQEKINIISPLLNDSNINLQNVDNRILEIKQIRDIEKDRYDKLAQEIANYKVSKEELLKDEELFELNQLILEETERVKKASIFTRESHKRKLKSLNETYIERELIVRDKIEEQTKKREQQLLTQSTLAGGIKLSQLDEIVNYLLEIQDKYDFELEQLPTEDIDEYIIEKYKDIGENLNTFISLPEQLRKGIKKSVDELTTIPKDVFTYLELGSKLFNSLNSEGINAITGEIKVNQNVAKLFKSRTENALERYLQQLLLYRAKKIIKDEFDIKISDVYKHYWYLYCYFDYLIKGSLKETNKWIYIDESQDLSVSELELIYKINDCPIMNLFGDINQVIMAEGIKTWEDISFITKIKQLNENFRNTNQIIDYCNENLHYEMQKVGVDSEPVVVYGTMKDWYKKEKQPKSATFIVKDDIAKDDLKVLLLENVVDNVQIYTVKEAKGLEFLEVIVFERDMTNNEKYISYTRALNKLTIINTLPEYQDPNISRIIQGDDEVNIK